MEISQKKLALFNFGYGQIWDLGIKTLVGNFNGFNFSKKATTKENIIDVTLWTFFLYQNVFPAGLHSVCKT